MSHPHSPKELDSCSHAAAPSATTSSCSRPAGGPFDGVTGILGIHPLEQASDPFVGCMIGDVEVVAFLAEGGMSRVYKGRQRSPDRAVAVKVLRPGFITPEGVKRFAREAEALGSLRHPNITQVFWAGACDILGSRVPFIVMELVPGALPITKYALDRKLGTQARLRLFRQVAAAVAHGHAAGIVHRDLKPGNVLVDSFGAPKLIDFGIARLAETSEERTALTELGRIVGTVQYMSPEQVAGDAAVVDRRTDVYALGLLLHELVTGGLPYEIDPRRVFDAARIIRNRKPVSVVVPNSRLPASGLERIIEKCLAIDPVARYVDGAALTAALDALENGDDFTTARGLAYLRSTQTLFAVVAVAAAMMWWVRKQPSVPTTISPATIDPGIAIVAPHALTVSEATAAVPVNGILTFHDVSEIPLDVAEVLVARGQELKFKGLSTICPELAAILGRNQRGIVAYDVRSLSADAAAGLARTGGPLCLDSVESLDVTAARALASHRNWLNLTGLSSVPNEVLSELVQHSGHGMAIRVSGMLDSKRAEIIARHRGILYLVGLESIDPEAAQVLTAHRGTVHVEAARISPEVDKILSVIR